MTSYTWNAADGVWSAATNWTPSGGPPDSSVDDAIINIDGYYTVSIPSGEIRVNTVTLDAVFTTLTIAPAGTLALTGATATLTVTTGTLDVGGMLTGGTVTLNGGSAVLENGATLSGITWNGRFALEAGRTVTIDGALTVRAADGVGPGLLDLTAGGGELVFLSNETLDHATLDFGSTGGGALSNRAASSPLDILTLGSSFLITQGTGVNYLNSDLGGTIVNAGTIDVTGGVLYAQYGTIANSGTIRVTNGWIDVSAVSFTNAGTIDVDAGGRFALGDVTANTGSIVIGSGGTLDLRGYASMPALLGSGIHNDGGTVLIEGTLDLDGGTLLSQATGPFSNLAVHSGTLANGTLQLDGGRIRPVGNITLSGMTWKGLLAIAPNTGLTVMNGLTVQSASGTGPGTIDLTAGGAWIYLLDNETLDNVTLALGSDGADYIYNYATGTVTLGSDVAITQSGGTNYLYSVSGSTFVSTAMVDITGGDLVVFGGGFENSGRMAATDGVLDFSGTTLSNSGSIDIGANATLILGNDPSNAGKIVIDAGGTLDVHGHVTLDELTAGTLVSSGTVLIDGTLDLDGGTLDAGSSGPLGGTISASGTLSNGTVWQHGGSIQLVNGLSLSEITWRGTLAPSSYTALYIYNGLTAIAEGGAGPGLIDLSAGNDSLVFESSGTLDNVTIDFGGADGNYLSNYSTGTLTLGEHVLLTQTGGSGFLDASHAGTLVSAGTINLANSFLSVSSGTFVNAGTLLADDATVSFFNATLSNSGTITVGTGSTMMLGDDPQNSGRIDIRNGAFLVLGGRAMLSDLDGGSVTNDGGLVVMTGTLDMGGGTLIAAPTKLFDHVAVTNGTLANGTVRLDGGVIDLNGTATLSGVTWHGAFSLDAYEAISIYDGLTVRSANGASPGLIDLTAGGDSIHVMNATLLDGATLDFGGVGNDSVVNDTQDTLTFGSNFIISITATSGGVDYLYNTAASGTIVNSGTIDIRGGSLVVSGGTFRNTGKALVSNGTLDLTGASFTNLGGIVIGSGGGVLLANGAVNAGSLVIDSGTLDLQGSSSADVHFGDGDGTLKIDTPDAYSGTIYSFLAGDRIELNLAYHSDGTATLQAGNILHVVEGTTTIDLQLDPAQNFSGLAFETASGSTVITVVCFLAGTRIATDSGEVAVEHLKVGGLVRTIRGECRRITWIGIGQHLASPGRRDASTPVIIRKGALADNVPHHDLHVTKAHSIYIDDVLIPVEFLVNHRSILWDDRAREVTLYHVELDTHDILLANGAPAESYRDDGNRWLFRNAHSGWHLPPQTPCAPVLTSGPIVDAAWRRLLDRAGRRPGLPLTDAPDLHLLLDGRRIDGTEIEPSAWLFRVSQPPAQGAYIASRSAAPQELGHARDPRPLGVAVRRIAIDDGHRYRIIDASDPRFGRGMHAYEPDERFRWTDGHAALPDTLFDGVTGPAAVMIHIAQSAWYVDDGRRSGVA